MPDNTIFQTIEFNFDVLAARLRELAFLNKGILLTLTDKRENAENGGSGEQRSDTANFYSERGLIEFVEYLDVNRRGLRASDLYQL